MAASQARDPARLLEKGLAGFQTSDMPFCENSKKDLTDVHWMRAAVEKRISRFNATERPLAHSFERGMFVNSADNFMLSLPGLAGLTWIVQLQLRRQKIANNWLLASMICQAIYVCI